MEFTNLEEQNEILKNLEHSEKNKQGLQNILNEAEDDWELVDKRKKKQKEKEKEEETKKAKANQAKMYEALEEQKKQKEKEKKEELRQEESIDIVEKLKASNPHIHSNKNTKKDPLEDLINSKKFEVVVKKKKRKNEGKKLPGK